MRGVKPVRGGGFERKAVDAAVGFLAGLGLGSLVVGLWLYIGFVVTPAPEPSGTHRSFSPPGFRGPEGSRDPLVERRNFSPAPERRGGERNQA